MCVLPLKLMSCWLLVGVVLWPRAVQTAAITRSTHTADHTTGSVQSLWQGVGMHGLCGDAAVAVQLWLRCTDMCVQHVVYY
jgi:hypothetical protein